MLRLKAVALAALLTALLTGPSQGGIIYHLEDPFDDPGVIRAVQGNPVMVAFGKEVRAFEKRLWKWKERDFHAVLGKPRAGAKKAEAMFSTEPRALLLSGLRYSDPKLNKDHIDTHAVGDAGRIDIWYGIDGETPVHI